MEAKRSGVNSVDNIEWREKEKMDGRRNKVKE